MKQFVEVRVWDVQDRRSNPRFKRPWLVRWTVAGREFSRSNRTRTEADRFRSLLLVAVTQGEQFDPQTGRPLSWQPSAGDAPIHAWARRWLIEQWPEWQPRTRASAVEALARFVPLVVRADAVASPPSLRAYLQSSLVPGYATDPEDPNERWLDRCCLSLAALDRSTLAQVDAELGLGDAGQLLAPATASRLRKVARACVRRAVELDVLNNDPWPPPSRGRNQRKSVRPRRAFDVRSLPDPATMARAIDAIVTNQPASRMYRVMTAVAYYAGLRPSEVVMLRPRALVLPEAGWGRLDVLEADVSFDEPGEPKTGERRVPIPPILVDILRDWLSEHDFADGDLMFRTRNDRRPTNSNWWRAWQRALKTIGREPLRVFDCRHAAATTWVRAGVPLGEVARRLGHSVETLVSTYVGALDDDESLGNARIEAALEPAKHTDT